MRVCLLCSKWGWVGWVGWVERLFIESQETEEGLGGIVGGVVVWMVYVGVMVYV